jgi:hypothetical protein
MHARSGEGKTGRQEGRQEGRQQGKLERAGAVRQESRKTGARRESEGNDACASMHGLSE